MSEMGLGRVKTPTFNLRVEIPSRFRKFENQKCLRPLLREDDRENNYAHFWRVHVFTQPGSTAEVAPLKRHVRSTLKSRLMHCNKFGEFRLTRRVPGGCRSRCAASQSRSAASRPSDGREASPRASSC